MVSGPLETQPGDQGRDQRDDPQQQEAGEQTHAERHRRPDPHRSSPVLHLRAARVRQVVGEPLDDGGHRCAGPLGARERSTDSAELGVRSERRPDASRWHPQGQPIRSNEQPVIRRVAPAKSIRCGRRTTRSWKRVHSIHTAAAPSGRLMKKIQRQCR